jgi:multidrug efflux pump subunit AcrA (membrane-fusion protein)
MAIIPSGDIATRTFTAKLKIEHGPALLEGMEATVMLPTASAVDGLLVPRDAVINQFGSDVVFLAAEGVAKMVPVKIEGYQGMQVAVTGAGLETGQQVVIKGNERIRDGQPVRF